VREIVSEPSQFRESGLGQGRRFSGASELMHSWSAITRETSLSYLCRAVT
jgi:hypothetical protein